MEGERPGAFQLKFFGSTLLFAIALLGQSAPSPSQQWVIGEIAYRVTVIPDGSPGARIGLRIGDVLAEPGLLPGRLRQAPPEGVEIPLFRLEGGRYRREKIRVTFTAGEEKRLGLTGDLGFLVMTVEPGSLAARAELRPGDFIPKIDDTFVHSVNDLKLVDQAYTEGKPVAIYFTRWSLETKSYENGVSRPQFEK
jgi:membrane-associated protease RseP (regulator of RpoE activity)